MNFDVLHCMPYSLGAALLEGKETIEPPILEEVAKALKVPVEAIKNFDEEKAINIFSNTYNDNSLILGKNDKYNDVITAFLFLLLRFVCTVAFDSKNS